ncbi:hypothetical protein EON65_15385 [archaeon]|nr:MAG: hypothetical protein EON65_15385 [archaeon]
MKQRQGGLKGLSIVACRAGRVKRLLCAEVSSWGRLQVGSKVTRESTRAHGLYGHLEEDMLRFG